MRPRISRALLVLLVTFVLLVICALVILFTTEEGPMVLTTCGGQITYGQELSDSLFPVATSCRYRFSGNEGDFVTIEMIANTDELDPYLELLDADGKLVQYNDDINESNTNSRIEGFMLPVPGEYTIVATTYEPTDIGQVVEFIVRLERAQP